MKIKNQLKKSNSMLILLNSKTYNTSVRDITKSLLDKRVCYVTLNKTAQSVKENLVKSKQNDIVIIDAISKSIYDKVEELEDVYYVSAPNALMELSLTITEFLKHDFDYIIFDSLTNLLIYQKKSPISKFVSNLINKIKGTNTKAIFLALKTSAHEELIEEVSMHVDTTIKNK